MIYTREQAEQVMKDWNVFHLGRSNFTPSDRQFLDHKFPQLPECGWLKHKCVGSIIFRTGSNSGYGLDEHGKWETGIDDYTFDRPKNWRPATKKEVQAMLEKEAERRGLVKGVKVKCLNLGREFTIEGNDTINDNDFELGRFWALSNEGAIRIMKDGIWATPIDDLQKRIDNLIQEAKEKGKNLTIKID